MSDPRAPDPTLGALSGDVYVEHARPHQAHRIPAGSDPFPGDTLYAECGAIGYLDMHAADAAFIAVPCRKCFPDAPPPGTEWWTDGGPKDMNGELLPRFWRTVEGLGWQLSTL